ncbi:putative long-chain-alcohol O-fatty-acyltransferase 1, partial [Mucuna pruriens]
MDGEIERFIKIWISAISCQCYCYYIASRIPKGFLRFLSLLPILYLFIIFPLKLSSPNLCFKLILFSFNQGPLALTSSNIFHFISIASLPINPNQNNTQNPKWLLLLIKVLILAMIVRVYDYKENLHPHFILVFYCCYLYFGVKLVLVLIATAFQTAFGFDIELHFNEPYLCTWNLVVTRILRPTVYDPIRRMSTGFVGPLYATSAAILATFLVSGFMHELMYYYLTSHVGGHMLFCASRCVHDSIGGGEEGDASLRVAVAPCRIEAARDGILGRWLFFPHLLRNDVDRKAIEEYEILVDFIKSKLPLHLFNSIR